MQQTPFHLNETVVALAGPTQEQIIVYNQWAATGLDRYHQDSKASFEFSLDGKAETIEVEWNSSFSKDAMKERTRIAEEGGVAMAMFVMSVLLDYRYLTQSEIGEGVDYGFRKAKPNDDNFFQGCHYVEVSALLEESPTNRLKDRVKRKHSQINNGIRRDESSSVIVTLFDRPTTVKEIHK